MSENINKIDDASFAQAISKGVVLLDFFAEWCGPCRMQTPILEKLAQDMKGKAIIVKIDVDESQKTAANFQINSIPTLILFKDGKEVNRIIGLKDFETLKQIVVNAL
jgi:thioredoxin 1